MPDQLELFHEPSPAEIRAFGAAAPSFAAITPSQDAAAFVKGSRQQLLESLALETASLAELRTRYAELLSRKVDAISDFDRYFSNDLEGTLATALWLLRNQVSFGKGTISEIQKKLKEFPCARKQSA